MIRIKGTDAAWAWRCMATAAGAIWIRTGRGAQCGAGRAHGGLHGRAPVAATNCLNFGNPEKPPIMGQFSQVIDGLSEACNALETPITGGNVSFYNETLGEGIYPTPVLGVVGILTDVTRAVGAHARATGRPIVLLTPKPQPANTLREFGSSEYAVHVLGELWGAPPALDLKSEKALQDLLQHLAAEKLVESARDVAEGGIAVAVAKSVFYKRPGSRGGADWRRAAHGMRFIRRRCLARAGNLRSPTGTGH